MSELPTNSKIPRKASLGINFEHGSEGAVVVYIGQEELVLAFLPAGYTVNSRAATALAVAYKSQKHKKPLTATHSKAILDRIIDNQVKPVLVGRRSLYSILDLIADTAPPRKKLQPAS